MSKYIDADKLKVKIKGVQCEQGFDTGEAERAYQLAIKDILAFIDSLQQQPEVQNGKFVFPKYLYARTKDNKTIDMSYAPQDMTAVEYIRNDFVEQEQPEVDLEKEIDRFWDSCVKHKNERGGNVIWSNKIEIKVLARHFAKWGATHFNARKEDTK